MLEGKFILYKVTDLHLKPAKNHTKDLLKYQSNARQDIAFSSWSDELLLTPGQKLTRDRVLI